MTSRPGVKKLVRIGHVHKVDPSDLRASRVASRPKTCSMSERFALRSEYRSDHVLAVKQAVTVKLGGMSVRYPLSDTTNRPSVCAFVCRSLCYRHTGCLQLADTRDGRAADPSADGRRSAASRTAIGGGISSRRPRGDNLLRHKTNTKLSWLFPVTTMVTGVI